MILVIRTRYFAILGRFCCWSWFVSVFLWFAGEEEDQVVEGHGDPLVAWFSSAVAFVDHYSDGGVVVACLEVGFPDPSGEVGAGGVFAFCGDSVASVSDACYVAAVFGSSEDSSFDAVVDFFR